MPSEGTILMTGAKNAVLSALQMGRVQASPVHLRCCRLMYTVLRNRRCYVLNDKRTIWKKGREISRSN